MLHISHWSGKCGQTVCGACTTADSAVCPSFVQSYPGIRTSSAA